MPTWKDKFLFARLPSLSPVCPKWNLRGVADKIDSSLTDLEFDALEGSGGLVSCLVSLMSKSLYALALAKLNSMITRKTLGLPVVVLDL